MNSFIAWVGGKKLLRNEICSHFPENIDRYIEVFGGAGWVLFNKEKHANCEVYNDINSNLVNLFRCMKHHPNAILEELEYNLNSRELFNDYKLQLNTQGLTDIQRAVRYLYLIRSSYGAKVDHFASGKVRDTENIKDIDKIKDRLSRVVIENKSFDELIKQYDRDGTLFYCDPPYYKTERYYDTGDFVFDEKQHINLCELLKAIKGKFILSYNNDDFIKGLYKGFNIIEVDRANSLSTEVNKVYKELIIKNY